MTRTAFNNELDALRYIVNSNGGVDGMLINARVWAGLMQNGYIERTGNSGSLTRLYKVTQAGIDRLDQLIDQVR